MKKTIQLQHSEIKNSHHDLDIILIVENVISPSNCGMLIRTAEAFGVKQIFFISEEHTKLSPKMKRSSRSTEKYVDITFVKSSEEALMKLKNHELIALEYSNNSSDLNSFKANNKNIALIVGNERGGVSDFLLNEAKISIHIPMFGVNSSINVAVATGIALNQLIR